MSVRREKRRDPDTGKMRQFWMIDIELQHPDGRKERVRKVSPVGTRRGAEAYEKKLREAMLAGRERKEVPQLKEFATEFVKNYAVANNKPSEVQSKEWILRLHLLPVLGTRPLDRIGLREVEAYKANKLREGLAPKTINNHLAVLKRMLTLALDWQILESAPRIKLLKVGEQRFRFLDDDESERLIDKAEPEWRVMILLAIRTGLRLGELLALGWKDVDLGAGRVVVRRSVTRGVIGSPKSGRSREVPLSVGAVEALRSHPRNLRSDLVFCQSNGEILNRNRVKWPLWRSARAAGLEDIGWHVLRHTFASHLVMRGAPLKTVQELLGHADIRMTMRYAHLSPDAKRDAVGLLDGPADGTLGRRNLHPNGNIAATENQQLSNVLIL